MNKGTDHVSTQRRSYQRTLFHSLDSYKEKQRASIFMKDCDGVLARACECWYIKEHSRSAWQSRCRQWLQSLWTKWNRIQVIILAFWNKAVGVCCHLQLFRLFRLAGWGRTWSSQIWLNYRWITDLTWSNVVKTIVGTIQSQTTLEDGKDDDRHCFQSWSVVNILCSRI